MNIELHTRYKYARSCAVVLKKLTGTNGWSTKRWPTIILTGYTEGIRRFWIVPAA